MLKLVPLRFGAVAALTVAVGYLVCAVIWFLFVDPSMAFMQALFHGLDFRPLYVGGGFSAGGWLVAVLVLAAWAFLMGVLFALLFNRLRAERPAS